jgi:hypothetical protein
LNGSCGRLKESRASCWLAGNIWMSWRSLLSWSLDLDWKCSTLNNIIYCYSLFINKNTKMPRKKKKMCCFEWPIITQVFSWINL